MSKKTCAVCGKIISRNSGTYWNKRLVHKKCVAKAEASWYRLKRRK